jgi:hypothetical protein
MPSLTGFNAYWIYVNVKQMHFGSEKYDITKSGFAKKQLFISKWNSERVARDGKLFFQIEERYPSANDLVKLYSVYYYNDTNFYVNDILNDRFDLFKKRQLEIANINVVFNNDLNTVIMHCIENKVKISEVLFQEGIIPKILTLDISPFTVCIFNMIFKLTDKININSFNVLEKKKATVLQIKLDKFQKIYYTVLSKDITEWKKIIRRELTE